MNIPAEFAGRVVKTRFGDSVRDRHSLSEVVKDWPESYIDVVYENLKPIVVVVFESTEDCLAFKLKYGDRYTNV